MRRDLVVGLFVSLALAVFVGLTLWLAGHQGDEPLERYSVYFESDVTGLMMGGPVFYLGVEVGTVTDMRIIPGDPMRVRVDIDVRRSTPIDTGTTASLMFQGVTGVAVINLAGDPGQNLPLKKPPGEEFPVIAVRDAGLAALLSDAPDVLAKVDRLLEQATALVSEENRVSISGTLSNVQSLTATLKAREDEFADLPAQLNGTITELRTLLSEFQRGAENLRPAVEESMENVRSMSASLSELTARLDQWASANSADMSHFLDNGLGQVPALIVDTRRTLREVQALLREISDNPSSVIYRTQDDGVPLEP
ncbi:MAG: MlaD family protein [Xanthomonadales bacterium]|nr:MlaD family protein [Xanthomonadales bacterium]